MSNKKGTKKQKINRFNLVKNRPIVKTEGVKYQGRFFGSVYGFMVQLGFLRISSFRIREAKVDRLIPEALAAQVIFQLYFFMRALT